MDVLPDADFRLNVAIEVVVEDPEKPVVLFAEFVLHGKRKSGGNITPLSFQAYHSCVPKPLEAPHPSITTNDMTIVVLLIRQLLSARIARPKACRRTITLHLTDKTLLPCPGGRLQNPQVMLSKGCVRYRRTAQRMAFGGHIIERKHFS